MQFLLKGTQRNDILYHSSFNFPRFKRSNQTFFSQNRNKRALKIAQNLFIIRYAVFYRIPIDCKLALYVYSNLSYLYERSTLQITLHSQEYKKGWINFLFFIRVFLSKKKLKFDEKESNSIQFFYAWFIFTVIFQCLW